jgi:transcriptional regulator of acetoin/glycerol metabolism
MTTAEERVALFELAIPELELGNAARAASAPEGRSRTGTILDDLPPSLASATGGCSAEIESAAHSLARARHHYHQRGSTGGLPTRSRIVASWDRCRRLGVDPDRKAAPYCGDLNERRRANEGLLRAAGPVVAYLAEQFAGSGFVIVVTDADGVALELAGDLDTRRSLARVEIEAGGDWSEAAAGTNAIGTALADRRPIQAWASEHFCEGPTALTCTAAPICVPGEREFAGVLNVSASYKLVRPHLLGVVMQASLEIEEQLAVSVACS